jgi:DNA polymerase
MFIGEGPGYHEDQQGRPFVGASGQLLDQLFAKIKLRREDVFITNVVKCRPPQNRDPQPEEIEACKNYLDRQIAAINPRLIITLGRISTGRFWPGKRIGEVHGLTKTEYGRMYMAMYHPSFALRPPDSNMKKFKEDGLRIPAVMVKAEELAKTELWGFAKPDIELAPPVLPMIPYVAEVKPVYPEPTPEPETQVASEPETIPTPEVTAVAAPVAPDLEAVGVEQPQPDAPVSLNGAAEGTALTNGSKPTRRPRKPREDKETEVPAVAPEKVPARRKKKEKEPDVLAEQLTMF